MPEFISQAAFCISFHSITRRLNSVTCHLLIHRFIHLQAHAASQGMTHEQYLLLWLLPLAVCAPSVLAQRGSLNFSSAASAWPALFAELAAASFDGAMSYDYSNPQGMPEGYIQSSPQPQPWWGTMWSRDAATFLRECVLWGDLLTASATAQVLMELAPLNSLGFFAFPGRFDLLKLGDTSLSEVDASAGIFISTALLWKRLPAHHPSRASLFDFLLGNRSIVRGFKAQLLRQPLVHGSGEFGGGAFTPGEWVNVAQNAFVAAAFDAAASISSSSGGGVDGDDWAADADSVRAAMLDIMINATTGGWCSPPPPSPSSPTSPPSPPLLSPLPAPLPPLSLLPHLPPLAS